MLSQRFQILADGLRSSQAARADGPGMIAAQLQSLAGLIGVLAQRAACLPDIAASAQATAERLGRCASLSPTDVADLASWADRTAERCRSQERLGQFRKSSPLGGDAA
jgi:hypothetical protein